MRRYGEQAGFRSIEVLPIEDDIFDILTFYRMMGEREDAFSRCFNPGRPRNRTKRF
jgi:hypothetical protein